LVVAKLLASTQIAPASFFECAASNLEISNIDNHHGRHSCDVENAKVHSQPSLGPKADGCVCTTNSTATESFANSRSDILHPNRANISKDELRGKLAEMYKATAAQVNVFGLQTQFGGGKTTGFALVYDSPDALKKFEPHYRLVRIGLANKIEKPSRQQRTSKTYT
jgi:ribosomal protein S24E